MKTNEIKSLLFGVAVGDALGVPIEFTDRATLAVIPVTKMNAYGTHNMPAGTWSDDSSLTFCLAEALCFDFDLNIIGQNFVKWYYENYWTPHGKVFDIGITTKFAVEQLAAGKQADLVGERDEFSNGNGSLMRISPLLFYLLNKSINDRFHITKGVSSLTHGHIRSVIACFYYLEFSRQLYAKIDKFEIYKNLQIELPTFFAKTSINTAETALFDRLLKSNIYEFEEKDIYSSGYVLHTLEASIWCLLKTSSYEDAVLKAVNLGEDSDTTGAVTGGLAGLLYGFDAIPSAWTKQIARFEDIKDLAKRFSIKFNENISNIND